MNELNQLYTLSAKCKSLCIKVFAECKYKSKASGATQMVWLAIKINHHVKLESYWWESVGSCRVEVEGFVVSAGTMGWDSKLFFHQVHRALHVRQHLGKDDNALFLLSGSQSKVNRVWYLDTNKYTNLHQRLPVSGTIWVGIRFFRSWGWFFTHRTQT